MYLLWWAFLKDKKKCKNWFSILFFAIFILSLPAMLLLKSLHHSIWHPRYPISGLFLIFCRLLIKRRKDKLKRNGRPRKEFCSFSGAATQRWILQQLHSQTVLAHINAFPYKCTIKHPFRTTAIHEMSGNFWKLHHTVLSGKNKLFDNIIVTQNHAWLLPKVV